MSAPWTSKRLAEVAEIRVSNVDKKSYASEKPVKLCNYMDVYSNEYVTGRLEFMDGSATRAEIERFGLQRGDVVITKDSETPDDIGIPAVIAELIENLVCGYHLALIRPDCAELDSVYLSKQLSTERVARYFAHCASGSTRYGLPISAIESVTIPIPTKGEQTKIAEILSTVDRAIEQTEALIAKQERIKTGLMQDLLTRGIDKHGELRSESTHQFKDSPLGRIPVDWEAKPLSTIVDLQVGYAFKSAWFADDGVRLLRGENVGVGSPDWSDTHCLPFSMTQAYQAYVLVAGDLVIGMDRTFTKQGFKVSTLSDLDSPSLLVQRVGRFIPLGIPDAFMSLTIQSPLYQRNLFRQQKGMDIPHLSKTEILSPLVAVPSEPGEMKRIASKVDSHPKSIQESSKTLRKYRSLKAALMQDLLTGKKRVTPLLEMELTQ